MKLYDTMITVIKFNGNLWYTAKVRRVGFLWRGRWKTITPMYQPSYEDAHDLLYVYY